MKENIEKMIENYNEKKGNISRREILSLLSPSILNTPLFCNCYDKDIKSDFYLYVLSDLDKLLKKYKKQENCSFLSWFSIVLQRKFIQYRIKKEKSHREIIEKRNIRFDEIEYKTPPQQKQKNVDLSKIFNLNCLSKVEKKIVDLKFGTNEHNDASLESKQRKLKLLEQRIVKNYFQLIDLHEQIGKTRDLQEKDKLKEKIKLVRQAKRKNEQQIYAINMTNSNKWIAEQLHIAEGTVSSHISRLKEKLRKNILPREKEF